MSVGAVSSQQRPSLAGTGRSAAEALATPATGAVVALTVLAAVLRFAWIGHQGFWFDEANTALLVHLSPGKMLGLIPQSESTPPLYYCLAWLWARLFGYGEAPLRSLSAVAGVATVPVAYGIGRKLISGRAGLIAAALTACNPLLVWYSQEARSYAMLVLWSSLALLAFAYVREEPSQRNLLCWAGACVLALATHYYALLAVVPETAWLLWIHRRRRDVLLAVAAVAACGLGLLVLAVSQSSTGRSSWIAKAPLDRRLGQVVPQFAAGFPAPGHAVIEPVAVALAAGGLALLLLGAASRRERRGALLAGGLALAGLVSDLALIAAGVDDLLTRNLLALWMPAAVMVAGGFAVSRTRALGLAAAAALCGLGIASTVGTALDRAYQRPDWRAVARVLGDRPAAGSAGRAILVQHYRDLLPLSLYLPGLRWMHRPSEVTELDVVSFTAPQSSGFCWWGSACNLWPSRTQPSYAIPGFRVVGSRRAHQFTVLRLAASGPVLLSSEAVAATLQTTAFRNDELLVQR